MAMDEVVGFSIYTHKTVQVMKHAEADDVSVLGVVEQQLCLLVKLAGLFLGDSYDAH